MSGLERAPDGTLSIGRPPAEPRFRIRSAGSTGRSRRSRRGLSCGPARSGTASLNLPSDRLTDAGRYTEHTIPGPGGPRSLAVERRSPCLRASAAATSAPRWPWTEPRSMPPGWPSPSDLVPSLALLAAFLFAAAWVQVVVGLRPLDASAAGSARSARAGRPGWERLSRTRCGRSPPRWIICSTPRTQAIARARARAADLAHGLKTPLTVLCV